jgi:hypothetical protein
VLRVSQQILKSKSVVIDIEVVMQLKLVINCSFLNEASLQSSYVHQPSLSLHLQILTWEKDSHGLYDYEATKLKKEFFEIQGPCKVFRNWYGMFAATQKARPISSLTIRSRKDIFQTIPTLSCPRS